jgi:siroheme decarboxylase
VVNLDDLDLEILKLAQDGIEMRERPYQALGEKLGISEEEVISRIKSMIDEGMVRRFAAAIGHRALGIVANAMIVWKVAPENIEQAGKAVASFEEVTHCYERKSYPEWPYNLYAMVHSRDREACVKIASKISMAAGLPEPKILFSEREYKKTSARI